MIAAASGRSDRRFSPFEIEKRKFPVTLKISSSSSTKISLLNYDTREHAEQREMTALIVRAQRRVARGAAIKTR